MPGRPVISDLGFYTETSQPSLSFILNLRHKRQILILRPAMMSSGK